MNDRRVKRFLIPIEDIDELLKGGVVTGDHYPADARTIAAKFRPEFGELEVTVHSASFDPVPPNWREAPLSDNRPVVEPYEKFVLPTVADVIERMLSQSPVVGAKP